ncbi:response regulator [Shewanella intestini]|uniref:Response regulator n=1 Tax=Shewanella intestini TaxID=2017544 RepID=A0ABS5HZ02_9GAMM|nr:MULTISPECIES: response regulator [Shewanella]MBR9726961.1 response regulator [Shewanella intestini]MRG34473.1 response regulator [Shewanella sp. XMDDZSB0408]
MRILIVEDSEAVSKILTHLIMQELGCEVDVAADYQTAIKQLEHNHYFVVIADLNLPDAPNGEIVTSVLTTFTTPCIVLTGNLDNQQRKELLKMGIVDYILKENRFSYQYVVKLISRLHRNQDVKVLVADDSVVSRKFVRALLEQHLFQVIEANDGAQALEVLQQHKGIQLLITDYNMPNIDGFELILQVRENYTREDLAIIGLSNDNNESLSARFIKNGANDFLQKPFVHEEFHCRVLNTLDSLDMIRRLWNKANRDYLTKAYTRRYFFSQYKKEPKETDHYSVALLDIDYFKKVNDSYGHDVGDQVLVEFVKRLDLAFGQHFTVARFGGEEFVVAFKGLDTTKAYTLIDKFRIQSQQTAIVTQAGALNISFSGGVTHIIDGGIDNALKQADALLYKAKKTGRNLIVQG